MYGLPTMRTGPQSSTGTGNVGVSHCRGRVAVCLSDVPRARSTSSPRRGTFSRVIAPRYMSPLRQALSGDPLLPAAVWCAKEALYKYARRPGLDLLHDLRVETVDFAAGTVVGRIGGREAIRAHAAACRRVYHGIYGIVPTGLPHGKSPPSREEGFPISSRGAGS